MLFIYFAPQSNSSVFGKFICIIQKIRDDLSKTEAIDVNG